MPRSPAHAHAALAALAAVALGSAPAHAGSDARLTAFAADDLGSGASHPSVLWFDGSWYRYTAGADGIDVQTSADGLSWSTATPALAG